MSAREALIYFDVFLFGVIVGLVWGIARASWKREGK